LSPAEMKKRSLLMQFVSTWLHALSESSAEDFQSESAADAFAALEKAVRENKFLVSEICEFNKPPPSINKIEEVLCKLCGIELMDGVDAHITAALKLYNPTTDDLMKEMKEAQHKEESVRRKAFLAALSSVTLTEDARAKLADFVQDEDLLPAKMKDRSTLMEFVSTWLHNLSKC